MILKVSFDSIHVKRMIQKVSCVSTCIEQVDTFSIMRLDIYDPKSIVGGDIYRSGGTFEKRYKIISELEMIVS